MEKNSRLTFQGSIRPERKINNCAGLLVIGCQSFKLQFYHIENFLTKGSIWSFLFCLPWEVLVQVLLT